MDLHLVEDIVEITDSAADAVRMISAAEAFRRFNWIMDAPVVNAVGNYRGMVISAQWKTVYVYSSSVADKAQNIAILLSVADELMKSRQQITAIVNGNDDGYTKAAKLSSQVSGIALRVLGHLATGTISGVNWVLRYTRWVNVTYWLNQKRYMDTLAAADSLVTWLNAKVETYLSGGSVYYLATIIAGKT